MSLVPQFRQEEWYEAILTAIQSIEGGGGGVVVNYIDNDRTITCSHTYDEISTLINNGVLVRAKIDDSFLTLVSSSDSVIQFSRSSVWMDSDTQTIKISYNLISHASDGTITQDVSSDS